MYKKGKEQINAMQMIEKNPNVTVNTINVSVFKLSVNIVYVILHIIYEICLENKINIK